MKAQYTAIRRAGEDGWGPFKSWAEADSAKNGSIYRWEDAPKRTDGTPYRPATGPGPVPVSIKDEARRFAEWAHGEDVQKLVEKRTRLIATDQHLEQLRQFLGGSRLDSSFARSAEAAFCHHYDALETARNPRHFGEVIAVAREREGYSQKGLAFATKIAQGRISEYETGKRVPSLPTIAKLQGVLGELTIRAEWAIEG